MKVAIVGSGLAALTAMWAAMQRHDTREQAIPHSLLTLPADHSFASLTAAFSRSIQHAGV